MSSERERARRKTRKYDFDPNECFSPDRAEEIKRTSFKITKMNFIESQRAKQERLQIRNILKRKKKKPTKKRNRKNIRSRGSSDQRAQSEGADDPAESAEHGIVEFSNAVLVSSAIGAQAPPHQMDVENGKNRTSRISKSKKAKKRQKSRRTQHSMRRRRMLYSSKIKKRMLSTIQEAREENEECSVDTSCISFSKNEGYHFNRSEEALLT